MVSRNEEGLVNDKPESQIKTTDKDREHEGATS